MSVSSSDMDPIRLSLFPAFLTSSVATLGFAGWLRFRRGSFPATRYILGQFAFSMSATLSVSVFWLQSIARSNEALRRMMEATRGRIEIRATGSEGAVPIPESELSLPLVEGGKSETESLMEEESAKRFRPNSRN
jgi:hypothetical protein